MLSKILFGSTLKPLSSFVFSLLFSPSTFLLCYSHVSFPQIQLGATGSCKLSQRTVRRNPWPLTHFYAVWAVKNVSHSRILSRLYSTKIYPFYGPGPISRMGRRPQHPQHPPPLIRHCLLLLTQTLT